jgi:hypothetical protein
MNQKILFWIAVAGFALTFVGVGVRFAVSSHPDRAKAAKIFFSLAALVFAAGIFYWTVSVGQGLAVRVVVDLPLMALVAAGLFGGFRFADRGLLSDLELPSSAFVREPFWPRSKIVILTTIGILAIAALVNATREPNAVGWVFAHVLVLSSMPWLWILGGLASGVIVTAVVCAAIRKRRRLIEDAKPRVMILTPLNTWIVGSRTTIRGSISPSENGRVQVLVRPVNDGWYLQPDALVRGSAWALNYRFERRGFSYEIVAVRGASLSQSKYDELDPSWVKSEIIKVHRERDDDDIDCQDKHLHQTKIDDKSAIKELVKVCMVKCDTSIVENGPPPYVDFDFWILSLSLHRVSIKSVNGYITFQKDGTGNSIELMGTPKLREESHAENLAFRTTDGWVRIRQPLDLNQAPWVKSGSDQSVFYFHHLNIMVEGDGFEPVRLDVDKVQKRIPYWPQDECKFLYATVAESETKVRELETANKALKTELDHLNREASDPTEKLE